MTIEGRLADLGIPRRAAILIEAATKGLDLSGEVKDRMIMQVAELLRADTAKRVAGVMSGGTQKVVINDCFGGFGISHEARKWLHERDSEFIQMLSPDDYWSEDSASLRALWEKNKTSRMYGFITTITVDGKEMLLKDEYSDVHDGGRTDPLLVECVETLKDKADGMCAKLKIVEVPLGKKWRIEEYDGSESIHEEHEMWS